MPRPKSLIPKLCIDKSRNRAFCKVDGKFISLGTAGTPEAQAAYGRLLTELAHNGKTAAIDAAKRGESVPVEPKHGVMLADLFLRFHSERLPKYMPAERRCIKGAIKVARELYGETVAEEFDVLRLRTVREAMIRKGWSRSFINKQVKRLRMIIRWAVGWKLVSQTLADSLKTVEPLDSGDSDAPESRPRSAVSDDRIQAIRPHLPERYRDMVDLMLLTGCRPGEIIGLTTGQIDRSGEIWRVALSKHKTAHHGKTRTLFFNATAQLILRKYLQADPAAKLFPGARGDRFSDSMKIACEEAFGMPEELRSRRRHRLTPEMEAKARAWHREHSFTPHWLRHTVATRIVDEMGTEAAQRLLGHSGAAMTRHYSKAAEKQAIDAVKRLG